MFISRYIECIRVSVCYDEGEHARAVLIEGGVTYGYNIPRSYVSGPYPNAVPVLRALEIMSIVWHTATASRALMRGFKTYPHPYLS